jgi:hypothetical protein
MTFEGWRNKTTTETIHSHNVPRRKLALKYRELPLTVCGQLAQAIDNAGFTEVVGCHFQFHPVADGEANESLAHFARYMRKDFVLVNQFYAEHRAGQDLGHRAFHIYQLIH